MNLQLVENVLAIDEHHINHHGVSCFYSTRVIDIPYCNCFLINLFIYKYFDIVLLGLLVYSTVIIFKFFSLWHVKLIIDKL